MKKKIEEMAVKIHEQSAKIYQHAQKEQDFIKENEELRAEMMRMKDDKMMNARGHTNLNQNERGQ